MSIQTQHKSGIFKAGLLSLAVGAFISACGGTDPTMSLKFTGLENLGADYVYEGWIMVDGAPVTAGRFSVNDKGEMSQAVFAVSAANAAKAKAYILTIEPAKNDLPAPTDTHVLAGDIGVSGAGNLETKHPAALGTDFSAAAGVYMLTTPTSAVTNDEDQGIWWVNMTSGTPVAGLNLPVLPKGWKYEGWIVDGSGPVSTGTFTSVTGADSDGSGPAAGKDAVAPAFPGQDFITPAKKLPGKMAVISIEPFPDNSPAPFAIKPLQHLIANDLAPKLQNMANVYLNKSQVLPSGTVQIYK